MIRKINPKDIIVKKGFQNLCLHSYHNHPKGCPNYGKKKGCPPCSLVDRVLDFCKPIYVIYIEYNLAGHAKKMRKVFPNGTDYQIYCCLYWQPTTRKILRTEEKRAMEKYGLPKIETAPEGHGVNVTALMKRIGVKLEWPPRKIVRLVSLGGYNPNTALAGG